jgi:hypothetical protein
MIGFFLAVRHPFRQAQGCSWPFDAKRPAIHWPQAMSKKRVSSNDDHPFRIERRGVTHSCKNYWTTLFILEKHRLGANRQAWGIGKQQV